MSSAANPLPIYYDLSRWTDLDIYLFKEGTHTQLFEKFGAHPMRRKKKEGYYFSVWAPNAQSVAVVADFNAYNPALHPLRKREDGSGIWEGFIEGAEQGMTYKFHIKGYDGRIFQKADPFAFWAEKPPASASRLWSIDGYRWGDTAWMEKRHTYQRHDQPINIYEIHLGSWRRKVEEENRSLTYAEAAEMLADYLQKMHYTHVELLPITEYPFEGSWGYQVTGYFAPTARYGTPQDLMTFVDMLHRHGIGVIMDWVPSHFVTDGHGLLNFDGTCLYEHQDPRRGYHPEWKSAIFNYGRNEVRAFLISSALFWLKKYHIDGIRVDAVASMLYLDYARESGEWIPNIYGGNENLEAIAFLKQLNTSVHDMFEDAMMIAEESTAYPKVTAPVSEGGLGFDWKWNMGWMHDTLAYFKRDPIYRRYHHHQITFSMWYAYDERFVLPLSHDEVVHMKGSLIEKMAGDRAQKFANLRALYSYMIAHPGKKLLFMGGEFGQWREWNYTQSLDWHLLDNPDHRGLQRMVAKINALYKMEPALHQLDHEREGFVWIDQENGDQNVLIFLRKSNDPKETLLIVCNFANALYQPFRLGVPYKGRWREIFNSQDRHYEGWGIGNERAIETEAIRWHHQPFSMEITLPPLGVCYFKRVVE